MIPRIVHRKGSRQTGPDTWEETKERLILWNCFGDWCLVSREAAGTPEVAHRSVLNFGLDAAVNRIPAAVLSPSRL